MTRGLNGVSIEKRASYASTARPVLEENGECGNSMVDRTFVADLRLVASHFSSVACVDSGQSLDRK